MRAAPRFMLLIVAIAGLFAMRVVQGQPITMVNPSFESGPLPPGDLVPIPAASTLLSGWSVVEGGLVEVVRNLWPAAHGDRSLRTSGRISQTISTEPGAYYRVYAAVAPDPFGNFGGNDPYAPIQAEAENTRAFDTYGGAGGFEFAPIIPGTPPAWRQEVIGAFTASEAFTQLAIAASSPAALLDDVSVVKAASGPTVMARSYVDVAPSGANLQHARLITGAGRSFVIYAVDASGVIPARVIVRRLDGVADVWVTEIAVSSVEYFNEGFDGCVGEDGSVWVAVGIPGNPGRHSAIQVYHVNADGLSTSLARTIGSPYSSTVDESGLFGPLAMTYLDGQGPAVAYRAIQYHTGSPPFPLLRAVHVDFVQNGQWMRESLIGEALQAPSYPLDLVAASKGDRMAIVSNVGAEGSALRRRVSGVWRLRDDGQFPALSQVSLEQQQIIVPLLSDQEPYRSDADLAAFEPGSGDVIYGFGAEPNSLTSYTVRVHRWRQSDDYFTAENDWTETRDQLGAQALDVGGDDALWFVTWFADFGGSEPDRGLRFYVGQRDGPCCYGNHQRFVVSAKDLLFDHGLQVFQSNDIQSMSVRAIDRGSAVIALANNNSLHLLSITLDLYVHCPADLDEDGFVGFSDLNLVLAYFNESGIQLPGDVDGDGEVNFGDLNIVLASFNMLCGATPE